MTAPPPPAHPVYPSIDFETYSEAGYVWDTADRKWRGLPHAPQGKRGLRVVGAAVYAMHPSTEIVTLSYDLLRGEGVKRWQPGKPLPMDLFTYVVQGGLLAAWNSAFEHWIWNCVGLRKYGFPPLSLEQLRDTQARARAHALAPKLEMSASVLDAVQQKDPEGERLIRFFSIPRNPTKKDDRLRNLPAEHPAEAEKFYAYCDQDVRTEAGIASMIPDLTPDELQVWLLDQRINYRGVQIDTKGVEDCIALIGQAHKQYDRELFILTNGTVEKASQVQRFIGWLGAQGVHTASLDEESVDSLLTIPNLPPHVRRALEIRQTVGSAAVKKAFAMQNSVTSYGRLHDLFFYYAARTGRATGNGPQPTNLPNSGPAVYRCAACGAYYGTQHKIACPVCANTVGATEHEWGPEAAEYALEVIGHRSLALLEWIFGNAMAAVSGSLRGLFIARDGHDLIGSDYTAIEAVVIAELAGETWRQEVFRTHGKIYEMSAAKISRIPFEEFMTHAGYTPQQLAQPAWWEQKPENKGKHHPLRKTLGKVSELSSAYQGWIGAWTQFGADEFMNEEEMKEAILAWRAASPEIVKFWGGQPRNGWGEYSGVEGAFVQAVMYPGHTFEYRGMTFTLRGDALYLRLLSGRELVYHRPRLEEGDRGGYSISYEGYNTNPNNGPTHQWIRMRTWGGRLTENIVQATARDILMPALLRLEAAGYPIVLHVYDEAVAEVPKGFGSVAEMEQIMMQPLPWTAGWPVRASGGWRGRRFRK